MSVAEGANALGSLTPNELSARLREERDCTLRDITINLFVESLAYSPMMHKLLYVSSTKRDMPEHELLVILEKARANNAALNVTGLLLYIDGGFLQVLEGERDALHHLYETIERDPRHWDTKLLIDEESPRNFGRWSMGFKMLGHEVDDASLTGITTGAIQGLIQPGGAKPVLDVLIRTFQTVQGEGEKL